MAMEMLEGAQVFYFKGFGGSEERLRLLFGVASSQLNKALVLKFQERIMFGTVDCPPLISGVRRGDHDWGPVPWGSGRGHVAAHGL